MAYDDWSDDQYEGFHDEVFDEVFETLDFEGLTSDDIDRAAELFEQGWLNFEISEEEREAIRQEFYDLTYFGPEDIDWETFRELYDEYN